MDPYEILGVTRSATQADIKLAYRKLAREWHPDRNKQAGAKEKFQAIQLAHDQLTGKTKYRPRAERPAQPSTPPYTGPTNGFPSASYWEDFFDNAYEQAGYGQSSAYDHTQRDAEARLARERAER